MPPIKARKISLTGKAGDILRVAKQMIPPLESPNSRKKATPPQAQSTTAIDDAFGKGAAMRKLRIPNFLSSHLQSARKYAPPTSHPPSDVVNPIEVIDLSDDDDDDLDLEKGRVAAEIKLKVRKDNSEDTKSTSNTNKFENTSHTQSNPHQSYHLTLMDQLTFDSMVFDVGYTSKQTIVVSCDSGTSLFRPMGGKPSLKSPRLALTHIVLGGGVSSFKDGRILVICRNRDTANIFSYDGTFQKRFYAGSSPMSCAVTVEDYILVADSGDKCIRVYDSKGEQLYLIGEDTKPKLGWPQYITPGLDCSVHISDMHRGRVVTYDEAGRTLALQNTPSRVTGYGQLMKPGGLCQRNGRLMVCDQTMLSVESYNSSNGKHETTILNEEQGKAVKPKTISFGSDGHMVIGSLTCSVWLFHAVPNVILLD